MSSVQRQKSLQKHGNLISEGSIHPFYYDKMPVNHTMYQLESPLSTHPSECFSSYAGGFMNPIWDMRTKYNESSLGFQLPFQSTSNRSDDTNKLGSTTYNTGTWLTTSDQMTDNTQPDKKTLPELCKNNKKKGKKSSKLADENKVVEESTKNKKSEIIGNIDDVLNKSMSLKMTDNICVESEFFCLVCGVAFWTEERFNLHLEGTLFTCRVCTCGFSSHSELKSHFFTHPTLKCTACKKAFLSRKDLHKHRKSSEMCAPKLECNVCHKKFCIKETLRKHKQNSHSTAKGIFHCTVCENKFTSNYLLTSHLKSCHEAYETLECKRCNALLLGPERLKYHIKFAHIKNTDLTPLPCSFCNKIFYKRPHLAQHELIHSDVSDTVCELCGKVCKGKRALINHIKYNHKGRKKKNAPVQPVVCEICGKKLKRSCNLKSHMLIHSNEKPFKCNICNATFRQEVVLKTHSRVHSNIGKYNCNKCGQSFKWKQTFDKHVNKC